MNKTIYHLRIYILSLEALVLCAYFLTIFCYSKEAERLLIGFAIAEDLGKYLMLTPIALATWVFMDIRTIVLESPKGDRSLIKWPEYWKLNAHFTASKVFLFLFCFLSLLPWLRPEGISTAFGKVTLLSAIAGQLVVALSVYEARQKIHEIYSSVE